MCFFYRCVCIFCVGVVFLVVDGFSLDSDCWPNAWKFYFVASVFEECSVYNAGGYRGVYLTSVLCNLDRRGVGSRLMIVAAGDCVRSYLMNVFYRRYGFSPKNFV